MIEFLKKLKVFARYIFSSGKAVCGIASLCSKSRKQAKRDRLKSIEEKKNCSSNPILNNNEDLVWKLKGDYFENM